MTALHGNENDFGALFEQHLSGLRTSFNVGDRITGTVTSVGRSTVFVDIGARSDGILDITEFLDEQGVPTVHAGDRIEAFCVGWKDDTVRLTTKMTGDVADASLEEAYESGIPVEGKVTEERKGGYEVVVSNSKAFCPYSQIDLYRKDPSAYIGERFPFLISEYSEGGHNIVVSRRKLLEQEQRKCREQLQENLKPGDVIEGRVTKLMPFGAFVDIGGAEGLIHVSELGWSRTTKPEDVLAEGQSVTVKVMEIDWEKDRISLSLKHAAGDPWETMVNDPSFQVGHHLTGTVMQIRPFGAFVELMPGIEGLVHVSRLGAGRRINHPEEVVAVGDKVEVSILEIDRERRRLSLSMDDTIGTGIQESAEMDAETEDGPDIRPGVKLKGIVDAIRPFGVFVRFDEKRSGLLHVSEVELKGSTNPTRALHKMFPPNSEIEVVVRSVEGQRISLTLEATLERERAEEQFTDFEDKGAADLGSLGSLFDGLKL